MERTLATLGSMVLGVSLAVAGMGTAQAPQVDVPTPGLQPLGTHLQRLLVAVPDADALTEPWSLAALTTRLHLADPSATSIVMGSIDGAQAIGSFHVTIDPLDAPADAGAKVRIRVDAGVPLVTRLPPVTDTPAVPPQATVIEVLGDALGIVAYRTGLLVLTPDELRLPTWRLPAADADVVALDGAWWSVGPTPSGEPVAADAHDGLRARLVHRRVSAMRRLVDVSVGDVTGDGIPDIAVSFRRPYQKTLLNSSMPRRFWTDAAGLSAHVGLYRATDLSEVWVAGTLVRPVRRLAACTGILAVAYSPLRGSRVVATSAWRWQGFAFLPLPELPGRGTPTCIDIDRDGRSEAAIIERSST